MAKDLQENQFNQVQNSAETFAQVGDSLCEFWTMFNALRDALTGDWAALPTNQPGRGDLPD